MLKQVSVNYQAFTDRPDHTEVLQIIQILQVIQIQLGKAQITQIPLRYTPVKYPPHTDPSRLSMMQKSVKYQDYYRSSRSYKKSRKSY